MRRVRTRATLGLTAPAQYARSKVHLRVVGDDDGNAMRPRKRSDCADVERPCSFVSCVYNTYLDVNPDTGTVKLNWPHKEPDEVDPSWSCALDVADRGGVPLEDVGMAMNVTREAIRQTEERVISRLLRRSKELRELHDGPVIPREPRVGSAGRVAVRREKGPACELDDELNALLEGERPTEDRSLVSDLLFFDEASDTDERLCASVWSMFTRASNSNGFACKSRWSIQASKALRARLGDK